MSTLTQIDRPDQFQPLLTLRRLDPAQKIGNRDGEALQTLKAATRKWPESEVRPIQRTPVGEPRQNRSSALWEVPAPPNSETSQHDQNSTSSSALPCALQDCNCFSIYEYRHCPSPRSNSGTTWDLPVVRLLRLHTLAIPRERESMKCGGKTF